ncbi:MAG: histidinol-phosphate transaminase [Aureispira sp.]
MSLITDLLCPHLRTLAPYQSARSEFKGPANIFLDANEAPEGRYNRYPDPLQKAIKVRLATLHQVNSEQIFVGNGSDEAIDLLLRLFCQGGKDAIITLPPTYGMYKVSAAINNVELVEIPLLKGFQPDVARILAAQNKRTKLLFVCSPNNPTGNLMQQAALQELLAKFKGLVVVDEAYIQFASANSTTMLLEQYPNLVVLQTLSKAWGLAGLRLGMAFAQPEIIDWLTAIKPPYNVNVATQELALEALQQVSILEKRVEQIIQERARLRALLQQLSIVQQIYPSAANFLLVQVTAPDELYQYLIEEGIVVRNRSRVAQCEGCLRFTVGSATENEQLLTALTTYATAFTSSTSI